MSFSLNLDSLAVSSFATAEASSALAIGTSKNQIFCCTGCDSGCGINPTASGCDSGGDDKTWLVQAAEPSRIADAGAAVGVAAAR